MSIKFFILFFFLCHLCKLTFCTKNRDFAPADDKTIQFRDVFDHLYIISMKSPGRWKRMEKLIADLRLTKADYSVFGVNGSEVLQAENHRLRHTIGPNFVGFYSVGELGCALSHRMVYEDVMKRKFEHALVVEDDAHIAKHFLVMIKWYRQFIAPQWKIIHWHTFCDERQVLTKFECSGNFVQNHTTIGRTQVVGHLYTSTAGKEYHGTVSYEINWRSASALFEKASPVSMAADGVTSMFGKNVPFEDYVQTSSYPPLVTQKSLYSEINKLGGHHK